MKKSNFKWRSRSLLMLLGLCFFGIAMSQSTTVTGVVTDANDGSMLPGVAIVEKGTTNGTITNIDGAYSIKVSQGATLVFNFIGYTDQEVVVGSSTTINAQLVTDAVDLDEIIAVGYGSVKKKDITGSVGSVSSDKLLAAPITSLDAGLQGKIAGVQVQQTTGAPGQKMKIRIRGGSSINFSNEPLYVIDGFIGADITTINPNDIASIDVLKDASATAIYGSRGANGVVLITTTAPVEGKMVVSFEGNLGVSTMVNEYDLLAAGEMAELMNLQVAQKDAIDGTTTSPQFTDDEISYFKKNGGTDWVDLVTRNGVKQNYTLNMNGGNENLRYFFSANYVDDQGVIDHSFYKRGSIRSNISGKVSKWIDFSFNTFGTSTSSQNNGRQQNGLQNTIGSAVSYPQVWEPYDDNGEFVDPTTYNSHGSRYQPGNDSNPIIRNMQNQETSNQNITSNLDLTFKFTDYLKLIVGNSGSFGTGFLGERDIIDDITFNRETASARQRYNRNTTYLTNLNLTYAKDFGKHSVKASAIYEFQKRVWRNLNVKTANLSTLTNEWNLMQNGEPTLTESDYNIRKIRSYMGRVNYSYADKYLLTASVRADGISLFQEDYRWGYFPSAAAAWRISEEAFTEDLDWLHNLKLRVGAGVTGNASTEPYYTQPQLINDDVSYIYWVQDGMNSKTAAIPGPLVDPSLEWEKNTQLNVGLDFGVLNGKLSAVFDLYTKNSTDVIFQQSVASYQGFYTNAYTSNLGEIKNQGFELGINWEIMNKSDFSWDMNFNIARNKNTVESLDGIQDFIFLADEDANGIWMGPVNNKFIVQEGESMGTFYGLKFDGIWQADEADEAAQYGAHPGDPKYEDILTVDTNGDGVPDEADGEINTADRQIIGNAAPDFTYGFGTTLAYKGFDLAIQCVGSQGNDILNYSRNIMDRELINPDYTNRWTTENTGSTQQSMPLGTEYSRSFITSQYIEDGSFFKIANMTLGYTVPSNFANKLKLSSLRFYVGATNLLTITGYSGLDPEGSSSAVDSDSQAGIDNFSYPLVRTFTGGLKVTF
ncbi:SusC/RagA family TonB-linked outer membrane protein [Saccharicrinis aurantiacus]|uniref:SusC/RagA family TonB-linked outer membrane protein n=1 Tax=Saccharicrinis aurantiacus TaxID=1849719 RepID=UPI0009F9CE55|nr:TonB-dependent receptor [Saccharicrinis aurantiacus]